MGEQKDRDRDWSGRNGIGKEIVDDSDGRTIGREWGLEWMG